MALSANWVRNTLGGGSASTLGWAAAASAIRRQARSRSLSAKTISTYRTRMLEKMHFRSNAEITAYALRNNLIS